MSPSQERSEINISFYLELQMYDMQLIYDNIREYQSYSSGSLWDACALLEIWFSKAVHCRGDLKRSI